MINMFQLRDSSLIDMPKKFVSLSRTLMWVGLGAVKSQFGHFREIWIMVETVMVLTLLCQESAMWIG